jgi:hypothetical protein
MARVKARKDGIVAKSREGVESWMRGLKGTEVIVGDACFVGTGHARGGGPPPERAAHLPQRRRARGAPALPGIDR